MIRVCLQTVIALLRDCRNRSVSSAAPAGQGPGHRGEAMKEVLRQLEIQRWDDHRYYHHSRINQSLHFVSACSFLCAYVMLFFNPVAAALIGWLVAMTARQSGHFFFEPKGYDHANQATHEHKE